ncbi:VOC family protein [Hymenobacter sp. BT491]|uniref:VOC family protein n=1 Tax=Hymenobacter sp. BT491 TaxID=2766779 RepID=UPI0016539E4D|nr:VOC family protein [Hymenobacter sp. BT491]MBC6989692.1 VOC family protein [Hymenobacter sp. BT491]
MILKEVHLQTADLAATTAFYAELLELPVQAQTETAVAFRVGFSLLSFRLSNAAQRPFYHFAFTIPSNQVAEAHAWISARTTILPAPEGGTILDFPNWNAKAFYFHDPNGNILECIARFDLPNAVANGFSSACFLGLNEIGLPTPNAPQSAEAIHRQYDVPYFVRGPRLPEFVVMGDDTGLFIMPTIGRGWLPTGRPAERFGIRVVFEEKGKTQVIDNQ